MTVMLQYMTQLVLLLSCDNVL